MLQKERERKELATDAVFFSSRLINQVSLSILDENDNWGRERSEELNVKERDALQTTRERERDQSFSLPLPLLPP